MIARRARDVVQVSNELEFSVSNMPASSLVSRSSTDLTYDVNPRDIAELRISMARDLGELNDRLRRDVQSVIGLADSLNGAIYGGSSILADVSGVEPRRYRTTSLSETAARGFLDITSQQIVIGINDEKLGFELYNFFRNINPTLLAITASSPYRFANNNKLEDTGYQSRRMMKYENLLSRYPNEMLNTPELNSLGEFRDHLQLISDEVNRRLQVGLLDANWAELKKVRTEGGRSFSYYPFHTLDPHQIYWFTRIRTDFANSESVFALELRIPDLPTTIERMQALNSFTLGLAYHITDNGADSIPVIQNGTIEHLKTIGKYGLDANIEGTIVRDMVETLTRYSEMGLLKRGLRYEAIELRAQIDSILNNGNDATRIKDFVAQNGTDATVLREHLVEVLRQSQ